MNRKLCALLMLASYFSFDAAHAVSLSGVKAKLYLTSARRAASQATSTVKQEVVVAPQSASDRRRQESDSTEQGADAHQAADSAQPTISSQQNVRDTEQNTQTTVQLDTPKASTKSNSQYKEMAKTAVATGAKAALFGGLTAAAGLFSGKSLKDSLQAGANVGLDTGIAEISQHSAMAGQALQSNAFNALRSGDLKGAVNATQQGVQTIAQNQDARAAFVGAAAGAAGMSEATQQALSQAAASNVAGNMAGAVLSGDFGNMGSIALQAAQDPAVMDMAIKQAALKVGMPEKDVDMALQNINFEQKQQFQQALLSGDIKAVYDMIQQAAQNVSVVDMAIKQAALKVGMPEKEVDMALQNINPEQKQQFQQALLSGNMYAVYGMMQQAAQNATLAQGAQAVEGFLPNQGFQTPPDQIISAPQNPIRPQHLIPSSEETWSQTQTPTPQNSLSPLGATWSQPQTPTQNQKEFFLDGGQGSYLGAENSGGEMSESYYDFFDPTRMSPEDLFSGAK